MTVVYRTYLRGRTLGGLGMTVNLNRGAPAAVRMAAGSPGRGEGRRAWRNRRR